MNRIRKTIACILIASMVFLLGACGNKGGSSVSDKSLYAHGLEMVSVMKEMASSEQYLAAYTANAASSDMFDIVYSIGAGDFSVPKSVYKISVLNYSYFTVNKEGFSDALAEHMESQMLSSPIHMINARGGNTILAASSICTFQKVFVASEQVENVIYLYTFEQATPVAIAFAVGEDNAVCARGMFILYGGENTNTVQDIEELFGAYAEVGVEEVTQ